MTAVSHAALLLQPGTRLVARLEVAATTAVKAPVVASIEYNYEREGLVILPAGTKVIGEVQQASKEGYVSLHFHTLQMPDGRQEKIEGAGVGLDQKPLKGDVSGKNTGKKILSRTLSGVGTIAAYVVGGGGGLNDTITGQTLLRDRVAGNIALAGEQELQNAAYSQNINVTVPANTRFYVVLQKAAVEATASALPAAAGPAAQSAPIPTAQELHELMELRQEINRMYQQSSGVVRPQD
jgi:type IV secretory pathway VirB10-like protein